MKLIIRLYLTIVVAFLSVNLSLAQVTYTATTSGTWSTIIWNPAGTPGPLDNVIIPDADTVTINQNVTINDLTVGGGTSGVLQFSKTDTTAVILNGNLLVQAGATFKVQTNTNGGTGLLHTLNLKGNLTHNGGVFDFRSGSAGSTLSVCNLTLSGTTNCTITMNTPYSTVNGDFNAVTINKTGGAKVILGSNVFVDGGSSTGPPALTSLMTFVSGIIETGPYVWVCQTSTAANVTGYSSASYIVGAMGRGMSNSAGSSKDFPVGDASGLRTFNLRSTTSGVGTGHYAIVRCISGIAGSPTSILTNGIDKVSQVRYFQVGYNHGIASTPSMSFDKFSPSYGADDGVVAGNTNLRVAYSIDSLATWNGINQSTSHLTDLSNPPTRITPDSLATSIVVNSGSYMYISLANATGGENPMPVELSSFTSSVNDTSVNLKWTTISEKNNKGFDIERKYEKNNWIKIGHIDGHGTTLETTNYMYTDLLKNIIYKGIIAYRLRQVDFDGTYSFSNELNVNIDLALSTYSMSQNYPNPFNPSTTINYSLGSDGHAKLTVYNMLGRKVALLLDENKLAGSYSVQFNADDLPSGVYFYKFESGNYSDIKKFVLMK